MNKYIEIIVQSYQGYAGYLLHEIISPSWGNYFYWLIGISLFFFGLEWWMPWRRSQKLLRKDFWLDVFYMFFNFFLFSLIGFYAFASIGLLLGWGTALVYPTFINAISDFTSPMQRAESLGVFRFWRDLGYALGALLTGVLADWWGISGAILSIGALTIFSALVIQIRYTK